MQKRKSKKLYSCRHQLRQFYFAKHGDTYKFFHGSVMLSAPSVKELFTKVRNYMNEIKNNPFIPSMMGF